MQLIAMELATSNHPSKHRIELAKVNSPDTIRIEATLNSQQFGEKLGFVMLRAGSVQRQDTTIPILEMKLSCNYHS